MGNLLIAGGDSRALRLAQRLKQGREQVQTLGLLEGDEQTARPEQADAILLPYPWSVRGGLIPTLTGLSIHPENVLRAASPGTLVLAGGGLEDTPAMHEIRGRELRVRRYGEAPGFAERNAAVSAEAAVFYAMGETEATLEGLPVMVLGYGLFGRETADEIYCDSRAEGEEPRIFNEWAEEVVQEQIARRGYITKPELLEEYAYRHVTKKDAAQTKSLTPVVRRFAFLPMVYLKKGRCDNMSGFFISSRRKIKGLTAPTLKWRKKHRDGASGNF